MTVTVEKGELCIRIPLAADRRPSQSAKSLLVATSGGSVHTQAIDPDTGKPITVIVSAYVKP